MKEFELETLKKYQSIGELLFPPEDYSFMINTHRKKDRKVSFLFLRFPLPIPPEKLTQLNAAIPGTLEVTQHMETIYWRETDAAGKQITSKELSVEVHIFLDKE